VGEVGWDRVMVLGTVTFWLSNPLLA